MRMTEKDLYHDGSLEGFLTAVFLAYEYGWKNTVRIYSVIEQTDLLNRPIEIYTDKDKAKRVFNKLSQLWNKHSMRYFLTGFLYTDKEKDNTLYRLIRAQLANPKYAVLFDYGNADALALNQWHKRIKREMHRMKAFVRFAHHETGRYCASIAPDYDVLPLIARFFAQRYADQDWLIADSKRGYAVVYRHLNKQIDAHTPRIEMLSFDTELEALSHEKLTPEEKFYQRLWQDYFHATNIKERLNKRLHQKHMPLRYWRYLTEKQSLISLNYAEDKSNYPN